MITRSIGIHLVLFAVAGALGLRAWTSEDEPNKNPVAAELWSGRLSDVQRIEFRTDKKVVSLEPKEDAIGRYYVGSIETLKSAPPPASGPDAGPVSPHAPPPPAEEEGTKRFVSLTKSDDLAKSVATMKVSRVLGKVAKERLAEFGLDKADQGTLEVTIAGKKHALQLGEKTPGGSDRYVQDPETGEAYVMAGSIANDLQSADSRLIERDFHDFADEKLGKVVLEAGGKKREIVRQGDQKDFWARPDSADTKDETVSNWMSKIDRLRVTNYVEAPQSPPKPEDTVVRLEYLSDKGKPLGFLELVRQPAKDPKDKTEYLARSERSRWFATVLRSSAEQIDQDLASVMAE
ncbi:MAG TPA: DUF4340 domain-containing protein [Polyangiaceae bacterium]|nr:DUF4340 domain-containing protein [Polyangiaceae bacterium]